MPKKKAIKKAAAKKKVEKSLTFDKNGKAKFVGPADSACAGYRRACEEK